MEEMCHSQWINSFENYSKYESRSANNCMKLDHWISVTTFSFYWDCMIYHNGQYLIPVAEKLFNFIHLKLCSCHFSQINKVISKDIGLKVLFIKTNTKHLACMKFKKDNQFQLLVHQTHIKLNTINSIWILSSSLSRLVGFDISYE